MRHDVRASSRVERRLVLDADFLESRTLLSATPVLNGALRTNGLREVAIEVPGTYVSQQSTSLDITLVRQGSPALALRSSLTVDFSAELGTLAGGTAAESAAAVRSFTPVDEPVTLAAGQTAATIVVPINAAAASPGLTPIEIAVTSSTHPHQRSTATVYLASGQDAIPPVITSAHLVGNGLAITFSKPMATATVENLHNYKIMYNPSQQFDPLQYTPVGIVERAPASPHRVVFRAAKYNPATDTVVLVTSGTPGTQGSYRIMSAPALGTRRAKAAKVAPLSDTAGNPLAASGSHVPGYFAFTIYRGHPYVAAQPTYSDGT
jgi:hypothetical protein